MGNEPNGQKMWIIPSKIQQSFQLVPECVGSREDLKELLTTYFPNILIEEKKVSTLPLTWKSNPSSSGIWLSRWKKVYWMKRLYGWMLKPSHSQHFTEKYTESLPDIHASLSALPDKGKEKKIRDTFSRIYETASQQLDLFGHSLKMSQDTSAWDMTRLKESYQILVTRLKKEYSQRKKLAHHIRESASLSSRSVKIGWKTPQVSDISAPSSKRESKDTAKAYRLREQINWATPQTRDSKYGDRPDSGNYQRKEEKGFTIDLNSQVLENWPTPTLMSDAQDIEKFQSRQKRLKEKHGRKTGTGAGPSLGTKVMMENWVTPASRDYKGGNSIDHLTKETEHLNHLGQLPNQVKFLVGRLDQGNPNTNGKNHELNPAWVAQLMGTTLEKIFSECSEMELLRTPQKRRLSTSYKSTLTI